MDDLYLGIAAPFIADTVHRAPKPDPTFMVTPPVDTAKMVVVTPAEMPRPRIALRFLGKPEGEGA